MKKNNKLPNDNSVDLNLSVIDYIKTFSFFNYPLIHNTPESYSEVKLREVARYITNKIQDYLKVNTKDFKIRELLKPKLDENEIEEFIEGNNLKDLLDAKTLKRSFTKFGNVSTATINIFKAFREVIREEAKQKEQISRIKGCYYIINSHNTNVESFQVSMINITNQSECFVKYKDRTSKNVEEKIKIELIGESKVLFTLRKNENVLIFYCYISADQKPDFFQGVYLYSNRSNRTLSNLAVFVKIKNEKPEVVYKNFQAKRELKNLENVDENLENQKVDSIISLRENIQYYLLNHTRPIAPIVYNNTIPFDFSKQIASYPSINQRTAKHYNRAISYIGDYFIYFNERFSSEKLTDKYSKRNPFFSSVGRGILKIEIDKTSGILKCKMKTKKNQDDKNILSHSGFIINHTLNHGDSIVMALYLQPEEDRYLNLHLNVIDEQRFIGSYNISYSPPQALGCGTVVMIRQKLILNNNNNNNLEDTPKSFSASNHKSSSALEQKIIHYLSNNETARTIPPPFNELRDNESILYEGLYKIYNYSSSKKGLKISFLKINSNGSIIHLDSYNDIAYGKVEKVGTTLNIILKNSETSRTSFLCVKVGDNIAPHKKEDNNGKNTVYLGTFVGVSRDEKMAPIASKIILEYIGKSSTIQEYENEINLIEDFKNNNFHYSIRQCLTEPAEENKSSILSYNFNSYTKESLEKKFGSNLKY